ncbi:mannonate dehydratase [Pedobacter superstes]
MRIYKHNLEFFKSQIIPVANNVGVHLHYHSDNPCSNLFGLPAAG